MRIVSLCPSLTELVFDLGRGGELVGATKYCVHPASGLESVERVRGTKDPDVARIVELAPDLVLMNEEENRREDYDALRAAGLEVLNTFPRDTAGTAEMVRTIARALSRATEGEAIAADIDARSARVRAEAAGRPVVRFAYVIWRKPWMTVNADTFADALLAQAGGRNVFGDRSERYPTFTPEELAGADPDLVLCCTEPFPFEESHLDELAAASGLARDRFVIADGEYLSWHGSRTPAGIDYAADLVRAAHARRAN